MTITVSCPSCNTSFPVDPAKVPPEGVRAQCSACPEIFDVDRPSEAAPEAAPATESTVDTIEASDALDDALVPPPPLEESVEEAAATGDDAAYGDATETEDFGAIDMAIDAPGTVEPAAEVVEADAAPVADQEPAPTEEPAEKPGAIRFGRRSAEDKARSLARSLVSDLIAYNPEKHKEALAAGTLQEVFGEEIDKSLKEYQEQVEPEVMAQGTFFNDALNSILAEEQSVFTLEN
jgi:predicted Zn finger-like uncharacterized protein